MKRIERTQLKSIKGGRIAEVSPACMSEQAQFGVTSCWHNADWTDYQCGLTSAQAQQWQQQCGGYWCFSSCASSCLANGEF